MCYMFPKLVSPPITLGFLLIDSQTNGGENSTRRASGKIQDMQVGSSE